MNIDVSNSYKHDKAIIILMKWENKIILLKNSPL